MQFLNSAGETATWTDSTDTAALSGTAVQGHQIFSTAGATNGEEILCKVVDSSGNWKLGVMDYSSTGPTLSLASSWITESGTIADGSVQVFNVTTSAGELLGVTSASLTSGNKGATVGKIDRLAITGATATISWTLPGTASVGDRCGVELSTDADATVGDELFIYAAGSDDEINGTASYDSGNGEFTRLLINGERLIFRCVDSTGPDWVLEYDGRVPTKAAFYLSSTITTNTAGTQKQITGLTSSFDVGGICGTNEFVPRRTGKYRVNARCRTNVSVGDQDYYRMLLYVSSSVVMESDRRQSGNSAYIMPEINGLLAVSAGDDIEFWFQTVDANMGVTNAAEVTGMTLTEVF